MSDGEALRAHIDRVNLNNAEGRTVSTREQKNRKKHTCDRENRQQKRRVVHATQKKESNATRVPPLASRRRTPSPRISTLLPPRMSLLFLNRSIQASNPRLFRHKTNRLDAYTFLVSFPLRVSRRVDSRPSKTSRRQHHYCPET